MIDFVNLENTVTDGLEKYLGCPVIRSNQNAEPPKYPYLSYTRINPKGESKAMSYGVYEDGTERTPATHTWSITALSDDDAESLTLAVKACEWFMRVGTVYLNDNDVVVGSVSGVTNRDNLLTVDYEYRNGFDVVFNIDDVIENPTAEAGYIETVKIGQVEVESKSYSDMITDLEKQLDDVTLQKAELENAINRLKNRIEGV
jgi:hypothetical protein